MKHIRGDIRDRRSSQPRREQIATTGQVLHNGTLLEMVYDPDRRKTAFCAWHDEAWKLIDSARLPSGRILVPYSPENNLLVHGVVRFPSEPAEYGSPADLTARLTRYVRRYVSVSPAFEEVAVYFVLFTWLYDDFNELPYLRVRGEPGCGKTRFLLTIGSLCYKATFASGASSVSPLFRILDAMGGTLVIDESDFRLSDEKADIVKILNNGNVRGFPVLRTEQEPGSHELNPRAYTVFGPKLVATRGFFQDPALESRFISEYMESAAMRPGIPISLPTEHEAEALELRNQLLMFRLRNKGRSGALQNTATNLEPRVQQVFAPLMSVIGDEGVKERVLTLAKTLQAEHVSDRGMDLEARVVEALLVEWRPGTRAPAVGAVAERVMRMCGEEFPGLTTKRIGWLLRRKLGFQTRKSNGVYVVAEESRARILHCAARYGIAEESEEPLSTEHP